MNDLPSNYDIKTKIEVISEQVLKEKPKSEAELETLLEKVCWFLDWACLKNYPRIDGKGVPDRVIVTNLGEIMFVELKNPNGKGHLSIDQHRFLEKLREEGYKTAVIETQEDMVEFLLDSTKKDQTRFLKWFNGVYEKEEIFDVYEFLGCTLDEAPLEMLEDFYISCARTHYFSNDDEAWDNLENKLKYQFLIIKKKEMEELRSLKRWIEYNDEEKKMDRELVKANLYMLFLDNPATLSFYGLHEKYFSNRFYKWLHNVIFEFNSNVWTMTGTRKLGFNEKELDDEDRLFIEVYNNEFLTETKYFENKQTEKLEAVYQLKKNFNEKAIKHHEKQLLLGVNKDLHLYKLGKCRKNQELLKRDYERMINESY